MAFDSETLPADFADAFAQAGARLDPFGLPLLYFSAIGSTNDVASALVAGGHREGAVVIADAQTSGRGRQGRSWFSPAGSGLYISLVTDPGRSSAPARATALLTLAAGVALAESIEQVTGLAPRIKWPNDLLVGRRKLAGILAEAIAPTSPSPGDAMTVVLGYGINVGVAVYPRELADRATSLESELGRPIDRATLSVESIAALARRYRDLVDGRFDVILDAWRRRAPGSRGARVTWDTPSGARSGVTAGIDDGGALLVQAGDRIERIVAGEVHWDAPSD